MGEVEEFGCSHEPEPREGSILARGGQSADLFNFQHYPLRAVCRFCGDPIQADSFFMPFTHVVPPSNPLTRIPAARSGTTQIRCTMPTWAS